MIKKASWGIVVLCMALGCGDAGGGPVAMPSAPMFEGAYVPRTNVDAERTVVATITDIRNRSGMYQWDTIASMAGPQTPVGQLLTRADREFLGDDAATSPYALERVFRAGLAQARIATTDEARAIAKQPVEKSLLVALELAFDLELRAATNAAGAGQWDRASLAWDRASAYFTGLESNYRSRSTTAANGAWGSAFATLTDENMAVRVIEQLARGRAAIDARGQRAVVELGHGLQVYASKYFFLSGLHYSNEVTRELAMMRSPEKVRLEGAIFFEGLVLPFHARSASAAVAPARMRWRGPVTAIQRADVLRDSVTLYADMLAPLVSALPGAVENERFGTLARAGATVDVLDEALATAGQDVTLLRARVVEAGTRLAADDTPGAAALLEQVVAAVRAVGRAPMGP